MGGRFEGSSSYNSDFEQRAMQARRERVQYKDNDVLPKGGFVGESTYQQNYIPG